MTTERERVLTEATKNICSDRENTYGAPEDNLACAGELQAVYLKYSKGLFGPAHENAMLHVLSKLARIATGAKLHTDNYVDGAGYFALGAEVGTLFRDKENETLNENYVREFVEKERALTAQTSSPREEELNNCNCGAWRGSQWRHRRDCPASPYRQQFEQGSPKDAPK